MKPAGAFEEECSYLLKSPVSSLSPKSSPSYPLYFLLFASLGSLLTLGSYCWLDKPATCLPDLGKLPFLRPYVFQVRGMQCCMFLACGFGATTLFTVYETVGSRTGRTVNGWVWEWTALISGQMSLVVLLLFALTPSEATDFPKAWLVTQEQLLISVYFLLACIHALSSFFLHSLLHNQEITSQPSSWTHIRQWTLIVLLALSIAYYMLLSSHSDYWSSLRRLLAHILFQASFLYMSTYQQDLNTIEVTIRYQTHDLGFKQLNRVTL